MEKGEISGTASKITSFKQISTADYIFQALEIDRKPLTMLGNEYCLAKLWGIVEGPKK
jgi:hypothetical protein